MVVQRTWIISCTTIFFFILEGLSLAACGGNRAGTPILYIPPPAVTNTPAGNSVAAISAYGTPLSASNIPTKIPELVCADSLRWLDDLTIPDNSIVMPGTSVEKQWLVENNGNCNWDNRYRLQLTAGEALGAATGQALYPARAGTQAVIRILFIAPSATGTYYSEWQAYSPQGIPFGDPVYMKIIVQP